MTDHSVCGGSGICPECSAAAHRLSVYVIAPDCSCGHPQSAHYYPFAPIGCSQCSECKQYDGHIEVKGVGYSPQAIYPATYNELGELIIPEALTNPIRSMTPSQLMDDIEGRDDAEDYDFYHWSVGAGGHEIQIVHTKTGLRGRCESLPTKFQNKREAWAQLQEQIAHHYGPSTQ